MTRYGHVAKFLGRVLICCYLQGLPESYAPLVVDNVKKGGFTHVLAGHSAFGKSLMPRIAALLDTQQISDIIEANSEDSTFILSLYMSILLTLSKHSRAPFMQATQ